MYVCTYVSVTLRNVNLQYHLGMSICANAQAQELWHHLIREYVHYMKTFHGNGEREGQRGWPLAMYVFCKVISA